MQWSILTVTFTGGLSPFFYYRLLMQPTKQHTDIPTITDPALFKSKLKTFYLECLLLHSSAVTFYSCVFLCFVFFKLLLFLWNLIWFLCKALWSPFGCCKGLYKKKQLTIWKTVTRRINFKMNKHQIWIFKNNSCIMMDAMANWYRKWTHCPKK